MVHILQGLHEQLLGGNLEPKEIEKAKKGQVLFGVLYILKCVKGNIF